MLGGTQNRIWSLGCERLCQSQNGGGSKVGHEGGDVTARETLRFTLAAIKNAEIDKRALLNDVDMLDEVKTQAKRRVDSIEQYQAAGRTDLVDRESAQLEVLKRYMPVEMSDDELAALVQSIVADLGASTPDGIWAR